MSAFQSRPFETNIFLSLLDSPTVGLAYNQVNVFYKKFGQEALTVRLLTSSDWIELGNGFYTIKWPGTFMDTLGTFFYTLTGTLFDNFLFDQFEVDPVPLPLFVPLNTCIITGNVTDIGGNPAVQNQITFRAAEFPTVVGPTIVNSNPIIVVPDQFGNFSVTLLQGQTVLVTAANTGIQAQIVVPLAPSALLIDLLPL